MMAKKYKKTMRFWKSYEGTCLDNGVKEEQKRERRRYNKHRSKK